MTPHIDIKPEKKRVRVTFRGEAIADTADALALKEGSYPVVYYIPRKDVRMERLERTAHSTHCPHKGDASYFSIKGGPCERGVELREAQGRGGGDPGAPRVLPGQGRRHREGGLSMCLQCMEVLKRALAVARAKREPAKAISSAAWRARYPTGSSTSKAAPEHDRARPRARRRGPRQAAAPGWRAR